jgi:bacterioferritin
MSNYLPATVESDDLLFSEVDETFEVNLLQQRAGPDKDDETSDCTADRVTVLRMLNDGLATEITGALRHRRHYFIVKGHYARSIAEVFIEHANLQQKHADQLAERIVKLGGEPVFAPLYLSSRTYAEQSPHYSLLHMIQENLVAARILIDSYRDMINYVQARDATTAHLLEQLLEAQEACAQTLAALVSELPQEYTDAKRRMVPRQRYN